ncbi:hypothetical protein [Micromonospora sp. WMMD714]|uniref:hypothetical protein n=1 Tax=Micromonospora sp. WMMD714 TaxID=3016097 RepID=UPI002499C787|nr:hypothetical protein [Micromonospora sp. WMMD714]
MDGVVVARLKQGSSVDLQVVPGDHTFRARLDWQTSSPLTVSVADEQRVVLEAAVGEHAQTFEGTFCQPGTSLELSPVPPAAR